MEKEWAVVHFTEENTVEAVPLIWFDNDMCKCYWPPKALKRCIPDLIKKKQMPEDDWDCFPAKILKQYDTYYIAKHKATKAQDTTDISSSESIVSKRKLKRNSKYSSSDDDLDENDDTLYPRCPMKNKNKKEHCSSPIYLSGSSNLSNGSKDELDYIRKGGDIQMLQYSKGNSTPRSFERNTTPQDIFPSSQTVQSSKEKITPRSSRPSQITSPQGVFASSQTVSESKEFQRQVLNKLNIISAKLSEHTEILDTLLRERHASNAASVECNTEAFEAVFNSCPIKSEDSLKNLEEFLAQNKENFNTMAKELSRIGGDNAKELCKRIMYRLFSNDVGQLYSWDGAKGKKAFKNLVVSQVILKAVHGNSRTNADDDEIIKTVKQWLVRSKDRLNNSLKKQKQDHKLVDHIEEEIQ